mgnify:CR=1 FL=1
MALIGLTSFASESGVPLAAETIFTVGGFAVTNSMLLGVLVAVGQLGVLASVESRAGGLFFAAVLLCSLFAAEFYEARMIWQPTAEEKTTTPAALT